MSIKKKQLKYDKICRHCGRKLARAAIAPNRWQDNERPEGPYVCEYPIDESVIGPLPWHEPMDPLLHAAQKAVNSND